MANEKKYASLTTLQNFLSNLRNIFAPKTEVAYISIEDNENIEDTSTQLATSDIVDSLDSTSTTRPLSANQGRVLNEKIEELEQNAISVTHDNNGNITVVSNFNNKTVSHDGTGNVVIS